MLQPKKRKYRKEYRGKRRGVATRGTKISFGEFAIKAVTSSWLNSRQIEAARKKIAATTKRSGKMWIRVFPHKPVTKKGAGAKMGSGKGDIEGYVATIKPGTVIFEVAGVPESVAMEALRKASHKLPMKTVLITKN